MIRLSFNMTESDFIAFTLHHHTRSPTLRRDLAIARVAFAAVLAVCGVLKLCGDETSRPLGLFLVICAGLWFAFYPKIYFFILRRTVKRMAAEPSFQKTFGEYTVELTEEGIASSSPIGQGKFGWAAVTRCELTSEHLFIFLVGALGYPIPRRHVDDATIAEVIAFVEMHQQRTDSAIAPGGEPT